MLIKNLISIVINTIIFFMIIINYKKLNDVLTNKILILFLAIVLVFIDIIVKVILGSENIWAIIIRSSIYPVNVTIFVYLILNRKKD